MKTKKLSLIVLVLTLSVTVLPGCYFTSANLISWLGTSTGLTGITVGAFFDKAISPIFNPDNDTIVKSYLELGKKVTTDLITNSLNYQFPADPGTALK